ncbi:MAG: family transcriptional regulator [Gammaproteobacteria bacterium]|jgi:predicted XRE-type DNA-binding protein|nr:family transcriptional regulator [Gammaproteobacteria bacterium]MCE3237681.1 family transcriptional regulator [Gammaproteobacteria bacterium]
MTPKTHVIDSSGNVFSDLGFPDAKERLAKVKLAMKINELIAKRNLKQAQAAKILGINQPKISALANGRLKEFSIERLIEFLNKLDQDVEIFVHARPKNRKMPAHLSIALG